MTIIVTETFVSYGHLFWQINPNNVDDISVTFLFLCTFSISFLEVALSIELMFHCNMKVTELKTHLYSLFLNILKIDDILIILRVHVTCKLKFTFSL